MIVTHKLVIVAIMISVFMFGCSATRQSMPTQQESLGTGIVVGSIAEREKHQTIFASWPSSLTVKGQVTRIEGAAYLVATTNGPEIRLPVDQDTSLKLPAQLVPH